MKAACGSGCDARRLSTGRSMRAWGHPYFVGFHSRASRCASAI